MTKKFYAVKKGRTTGIFNNWETCKRAVEGYSNAAFRSFKDYPSALAYLKDEPGASDKSVELTAYVDGSYDVVKNAYSYGLVLLIPGHETVCESGAFDDPNYREMRNVAGELAGAIRAIDMARKMGVQSLRIVHDYTGIEKWCTGEWKASKPGTIAYADFCKAARDDLRLYFRKVKSHSGDTYNDMADQLAKDALKTFQKG